MQPPEKLETHSLNQLSLVARYLFSLLSVYFFFALETNISFVNLCMPVLALLLIHLPTSLAPRLQPQLFQVLALTLLWLILLLAEPNDRLSAYFSLLILLAFLLLPPVSALRLSVIGTVLISVQAFADFSWVEALNELLPIYLMLITGYFLAAQLAQLQLAMKSLRKADWLTACGNQVALQEHMTRAISYQQRYGIASTLVALKIRGMGARFARNGEEKSHQLLTELASIWLSRIRHTDALCRYDNELFICVLSGTNEINATTLADDLVRAAQVYELSDAETVEIDYHVIEYPGEGSWDGWLTPLLAKE